MQDVINVKLINVTIHHFYSFYTGINIRSEKYVKDLQFNKN